MWHGTLKDAGFDDGQFDVITASEILEHLDDPLGELTEIARILRPGGLLWATTPSARSLSFRVMKERWTVISPPEHTQLRLDIHPLDSLQACKKSSTNP